MKKGFIKCELCHNKIILPNSRQRFCGSYRRKQGCSYINHLERKREYGHPNRLTLSK